MSLCWIEGGMVLACFFKLTWGGGGGLQSNSVMYCTSTAAMGRTARAEARSLKNKGLNADLY